MGTVPGHPGTPRIENFEYRDLRGSPGNRHLSREITVPGGTGGTNFLKLTKAKNTRYR